MDQLERFCAGFLKQSPVLGAVPFAGAVSMIEDVTSILLYRRDQFQVQMFAVPEHTVIPEHSHPNVDTIAIYVGGNIRISVAGKFIFPENTLFAMDGPLGLASRRGLQVRLRPNVRHGLVIGEGGGVFFAVEHWLNGIAPHCVAEDYDGVTMGEHHLGKVIRGEARTKELLTAADAALLEA